MYCSSLSKSHFFFVDLTLMYHHQSLHKFSRHPYVHQYMYVFFKKNWNFKMWFLNFWKKKEIHGARALHCIFVKICIIFGNEGSIVKDHVVKLGYPRKKPIWVKDQLYYFMRDYCLRICQLTILSLFGSWFVLPPLLSLLRRRIPRAQRHSYQTKW